MANNNTFSHVTPGESFFVIDARARFGMGEVASADIMRFLIAADEENTEQLPTAVLVRRNSVAHLHLLLIAKHHLEIDVWTK